jgi:hypothetical protein
VGKERKKTGPVWLSWKLRVRSKAWWYALSAELVFVGLTLWLLSPSWGAWLMITLWGGAHMHLGHVECAIEKHAEEVVALEKDFELP